VTQQQGEKPGAEKFSAGAVHRAVLAETLQHPLTVLPAAVSALSGLYMGLISFDPGSFAVGFGAALFGAAAWVVNYFFRGERFAEAHVRKLRAERERFKQIESEALRARCAAAGFEQGAEAVADMTRAFGKLRQYLEDRAADGSLDAMRFQVLAEDTYQQGIAILQAALDSHRALAEIDTAKLRRELAEWERELPRLEGQFGADDARCEALRKRMDSHRRRLGLHDERNDALHQLLAEAEVLESALESAYLEVLDLGRDTAVAGRSEAAERLATAIGAARRVEDRLRGTRDSREEDELYRREGQRQR